MSRSEKSDELDLRWTTALVMVSEYLMYSPRVKMTREQALATYWVKSESDPRRMKEGDQVADGLATHRRMQAELRRDLALDHNEKFFPYEEEILANHISLLDDRLKARLQQVMELQSRRLRDMCFEELIETLLAVEKMKEAPGLTVPWEHNKETQRPWKHNPERAQKPIQKMDPQKKTVRWSEKGAAYPGTEGKG